MKQGPRVILFRCDGTAETGLGHVSRCLSLAEAAQELGLICRFRGRFEAGAARMLAAAGMSFDDAFLAGSPGDLEGAIAAARSAGARAVVLDSYSIDDGYVTALDRDAAPLLLIDDFYRLGRTRCATLLNFTVNAPNLGYPDTIARRLLGPEYLLVRRRLRQARWRLRPRTGPVQRLLVAMGGSDALDLSRRLAKALLRIAVAASVQVIVGCDYRFVPELAELVRDFRGGGQVVVQAPDLSEALAWADACICAGGLTKYEAAYLGVPAAVWSQNSGQNEETQQFAARGLAFDLGLFQPADDDAELTQRLSRFLGNANLRESQAQAAWACFPEDPTIRAAEELARMVDKPTERANVD